MYLSNVADAIVTAVHPLKYPHCATCPADRPPGYYRRATMQPQLSFIIPTHNRPAMLATATDSVLAQTLTQWELIIVDDGSSPETAEFIATLSDPRIRSCRHESPKGAAAARNTGLEKARADYVAFLDDDDALEPEYAQRMLAVFEEHQAEIDFAWPALMETDLQTGSRKPCQQATCLIKSGNGPEDDFAAAAYTRTTGMVFRRAALNRAGGFDETLAVSEDRDLVFRLLGTGSGCASVREPLVRFLIHSGPRLSTSDDLAQQANCDRVVASRHEDLISAHPKLASRVLNLLARRQKDAGQRKESRHTLRQLIAIRPTDLRAHKRLLKSLFDR